MSALLPDVTVVLIAFPREHRRRAVPPPYCQRIWTLTFGYSGALPSTSTMRMV